MAFCAHCGAVVVESAAFCAGCGKPVTNPATSAGAPSSSSAVPSTSASAPASQAAASGLTPNMAGALAYVLGFITGIIFLVLEPYKNDRFVRFHAMQSIFYSVACIAFGIVWGIFWGIVFAASTSLGLILAPVRLIISLAMFVYWLYLMYQAYNNREYRIPIIGDLAAKQVG